MSDGQPLVQSLATRMQLSLLGTANTIAHSVRVSRGIAEALRKGGVIRRVSPKAKTPVRLSAVSAMGSRDEAYGGYLSLAVAVRRDVTIHAGQIAHGIEDSICDIDVLPYGDVRQRVGLKQYAMVYRLLKRIVNEPLKPDILLVDRTLLLPKEFASSNDREVQQEYERLATTAGVFWNEVREQLCPWRTEGPVIVGFPQVKRMGEPLWSIANDRPDALIDPVNTGSIRSSFRRERPLDEGAASRIMATVIWPEQRSAAFAYSGLDMDPRTEPQVLRHQLDIASFHYRSGMRTPPQQIEVVGGRIWSSESLDRLAEQLIEATPFDQPDAMPLPLWLARRQFQALQARKWLEQYQKEVFSILRSGELDKAWLRGWEPEGA
jgi:hypothetical protein